MSKPFVFERTSIDTLSLDELLEPLEQIPEQKTDSFVISPEKQDDSNKSNEPQQIPAQFVQPTKEPTLSYDDGTQALIKQFYNEILPSQDELNPNIPKRPPPTLESLENEVIQLKTYFTMYHNLHKKQLEKLNQIYNAQLAEMQKQALKLIPSVQQQDGSFPPTVKELTDANISEITNPTFILFYTPNCPHCVNVKPIFIKTVNTLISNGVAVGALNGMINRKTMTDFQIKGVPSMVLVFNSKRHVYQGKRDAQEIVNWIHDLVIPADKR
jgi:thiol-disulfide isomerase/thioredoxin